MGVNVEIRIQKLEDELKALKATYTLSGGLMRVYESVSPVYPFTVNPGYPPIIKFTSDFVNNQPLLIASIMVKEDIYGGGTRDMSTYTTTHIQTGDGSIYIYPAYFLITDSIQIKLVTTSPGTFTRIQ